MSAPQLRRRPAAPADTFSADVHPVLRRVYAARGALCDADLDLSLKRLLPIGSLGGIDAAVALLAEQRSTGRVLVIGDFDADGATSSALVVRALRALRYAHVDFLVPNRFKFGYGLTPEIVELAATRRPTLLVTVDNGVSSVDGVEAARARGLPVLITDHHLPGAALPRAAAIVNPNLAGSTFGSPALAGVGVAFYLMAALSRQLAGHDFQPADLLDLVALGTVADVVPLDHNNRVLVLQGLRRIRAGACVPGLRALLEAGGRRTERASAADLGFAAAPRLNAAGRLTDMSVGIACLLADEPAVAMRLAAQLSALNEERRGIEQRMQQEAIGAADRVRTTGAGEESLGVCIFDESWHQGVVGLVAARIKDRLHRPVVAFARAADGSLRGSARSIPGVNIRDAFDSIAVRHPGMIDKFGGHAMAAGLSLQGAQLAAFREAFAAEIAQRADKESLTDVILTDGELYGGELSLATACALRDGGPWGQGFPEPVFDGLFAIEDTRIVGEKHLKLGVRSAGRPEALEAIAFGYVGGPDEDPSLRRGAQVRLAYRLEVNAYRGVERVQLNCRHLKVA
jgi:single-stranded-DNA-specific exonuclease